MEQNRPQSVARDTAPAFLKILEKRGLSQLPLKDLFLLRKGGTAPAFLHVPLLLRKSVHDPSGNFFSRRAHPEVGFTLMEILLVLLILGIIAGLSIPHLSRTYHTMLLNRTTNDLASLIRYAQSRAIIQRQVFQLSLDPQSKRYCLRKADSNSPDKKLPLHFSPVAGRLGRALEIPQEIQILAQNPTIDFQPDGKMAKVNWSLCDRDHCLSISTKEQSGYVQVFQEN